MAISQGSKILASDVSSFIIPSGVIVMWSGAANAIPSGWYLCNGSNGTPDLRNKFIVGAGNTYSVGATGGEASHTLTQAELPLNLSLKQGASNTGSGQTIWATNSARSGTFPFGSGSAHNNLPPYYALCYIMKS